MRPHPIKGLRHFSRVPFEAKVQLVVHEETLQAHLIDIALKGALIETEQSQELGLQTPCRLILPLTNGEDSIVMTGCVTHLEGRHVGIKCLQIDIDHLTRVRRLIELNTGDAALVDRELSMLFSTH